MNNIAIAGLQKLSLVDYPGRMAATVFLSGCQMRCPFCHNSELTQPSYSSLSEPQLLQFLEKRKTILDGVVITGGEPTLQPIRRLIEIIKQIGYPVKLDTNGLRPDVLEDLLNAQLLDYVAMDIKNDPDNYARTAGTHINIDLIRASIKLLLNAQIPYEFRTTIVPELHTDRSMQNIGQLIQGADQYALQPFVMRDTVPQQNFTEPSDDMMVRYLNIVKPYVRHAFIRGRDLNA